MIVKNSSFNNDIFENNEWCENILPPNSVTRSDYIRSIILIVTIMSSSMARNVNVTKNHPFASAKYI